MVDLPVDLIFLLLSYYRFFGILLHAIDFFRAAADLTTAVGMCSFFWPPPSHDHDHCGDATVTPPAASNTTAGLQQHHSERSPAVPVSTAQQVSRARLWLFSDSYQFFFGRYMPRRALLSPQTGGMHLTRGTLLLWRARAHPAAWTPRSGHSRI